MAGYYVRPEEKPSNKLKARGTSKSNILNSWIEFWKMFKNFSPIKVRDALNKRTEAQMKLIKEASGK